MGRREVVMRKVLAIAVTVLAGAVTLSADQPVNPQANAKFGALRRTPPASPYEKLFELRGALNNAVEQSQPAPAPKSRVVCGMTVIEVDPAIDPKIGVTPPGDEKTRYTIRAVEPPICK